MLKTSSFENRFKYQERSSNLKPHETLYTEIQLFKRMNKGTRETYSRPETSESYVTTRNIVRGPPSRTPRHRTAAVPVNPVTTNKPSPTTTRKYSSLFPPQLIHHLKTKRFFTSIAANVAKSTGCHRRSVGAIRIQNTRHMSPAPVTVTSTVSQRYLPVGRKTYAVAYIYIYMLLGSLTTQPDRLVNFIAKAGWAPRRGFAH